MYTLLIEIESLDLYQYIGSRNPSRSSCLSQDELFRYYKNFIPDRIYQQYLEYYNAFHELSTKLKCYNEMHLYEPLYDTVNTASSITHDYFLEIYSNNSYMTLKTDFRLLLFAIQKLRKK